MRIIAHILDAVIQLKDNFSKTLSTVEKNIGGFSRTARNMAKDINKVGKDLTKLGGDLTKKVTLPIVGIGAAAIKVGMDFEASMSQVKAMSGATADEMVLLEKAARDAGAITSKSAKESADALGFMALAGWDVNTSIKGLMPVLRLSEAGNIDLARASSLVTDSMSAMGIQVQDLPRYLDVVAQTARSANTDIDQMAAAYLGVGGTLRGLNVNLEESALALGFLANAGIKGSEAGTSLNAILTNLTAPTGRAKKALEQLKLSAFDKKGNFKGLEDVLFELQGKLKSMTTEQRNMYMSMIGGKEHIKSLNALMNGLDDSYSSLKTSISQADGALDEIAKTMQDNNKGSITELLSALEELGLKGYDMLRPAIASGISILQKFTDKLNALTPQQQETIIKILGIAAAVGPLILLVGKLTTGVSKGIFMFADFSKRVKALGLTMKAIVGPGAIVAGVIAGLVIGGILLYKNWDKIKAKVNEVFPNLKETISTTMEYVRNIFDATVKFLSVALLPVQLTFQIAWETIKNIFWVGVEFIGSVVGNLLRALSGIIDFIVGVFTLNWELAWKGIVDIFGGIFGGVEAVGKATINGMIGLINGAIGGINKIKVPDWVPGIGGKGITIPLIPQLAKGTSSWAGGIVQVHEKGGEIIDLPSKSRVYPHDKSVSMAREQGRKESSRSVSIAKLADQIIVREESDIDKIATEIVRKIEMADLNMA